MPPTNDPQHRHLKAAPSARRKSKPKFEVPAETGLPEAPVGWVYRADEVPAPPLPTAAAPQEPEESSKSSPYLVAGMGLFFIGVGTMGMMTLLAIGLVSAPARMAKRMLTRD
jgi:hypothetical protein